MNDIANVDLPYAPTLREMPVRGADELKRSLDDIVTPGDVILTAGATACGLRACRLTGGGVLATVQLGHQEVRHESGHLRELTGDDVIVLVALDGSGTVTQQGRVLPFGKGDITFRRARVPSVARIDEPASLVMLRLPITRFLGHATSRHALFTPHRADAESGIVSTIHRFIDSVLPAFAHMSPATVAAAEESLVALLSASYFEAIDRTPPKFTDEAAQCCHPLRWSQLTTYIAANLRDPELDVESCARALGVSKRYVHMIFETMSMQYGKYVLQQRLTRCRDDLVNPIWSSLSIERIAYRNGFNDPAHFSRSFRASFGTSPRDFRQRDGRSPEPALSASPLV
jgi:AraC family transcriptional regulator, positive regulator of tynA and feaB